MIIHLYSGEEGRRRRLQEKEMRRGGRDYKRSRGKEKTIGGEGRSRRIGQEERKRGEFREVSSSKGSA